MPAKEPDPPKITLKFGGQRQTASNGVSVDSESLKRQQQLVNAGANGQGPIAGNGHHLIASDPSRRAADSQTAPGPSSVPIARRSDSAEHPMVNGVKKETAMSQSPTLGAVHLNGDIRRPDVRQSPMNGSMAMPPPLNNMPRMTSGSPLPQAALPNTYISTSHASTSPFDARWRQNGKGESTIKEIDVQLLIMLDASDALLANLNISTHPGLKLSRPFNLDIPPSPTTTQQSVTVNLPSTHFFLRIRPTLAPALSIRPYKVFVTANMQRLNPIPERPEDTEPRRPLYEARVTTGNISRIEIEVVAGSPRGAPKVGTGPDIEIEKTTLFVSLAKG